MTAPLGSQRLARPPPRAAPRKAAALSLAVVNLGLKSIRCIVFDARGGVAHAQSLPVHTELSALRVEQDANEWLEGLASVLAAVVPNASNPIEALTVSTSASCLVPVDAEGRPTHRVIMVSDGRAVRQAEALGSTADRLLPKILWLRENDPETFARTTRFLSALDFLGLHLTGVAVTDTNSAAKFGARSQPGSAVEYDCDLLRQVGVSVEQLPAIAVPGTIVGRVSAAAAKRHGLSTDTRFVLGTYDALSAVVGSGVCTPGVGAAVGGTVTSLRSLAASMPDSLPQGIVASGWPEPGSQQVILGASNNLGGGLVEWHKQAFYADTREDAYTVMDREASDVRGSDGLIFLPYLLGERAPIWDARVRGAFFGLDRRHTRSHFTRAVFESIAFSTRHLREHVAETGCDFDALRFSGGLSRLTRVGQILADVLQVPVSVPAEFETTSLGAHILAARALGHFSSLAEGCEAMVSPGRSFEPRPQLAELYDALFGLYKGLYTQTRALQDERNRILDRFGDLLDSGATRRENL